MNILDLLRSDGSIIVNKKLAHAIGIDAAIMFSELISKQAYFKNKEQLTEDGYFFNTVENMQEDTALTKYQQSKAIKRLVELGLIFHQNRGLPQRRYFKINEGTKILEILGISQKSKNQQLEVKKLDSNNTKNNNTKKDLKTKGTEQYSALRFSFNDFKNNTSLNDIEKIEVVEHYLDCYKQHIGKEHPKLKKEQWDYVVEDLFYISSGGIDFDLDESAMIDMINQHFKTTYQEGCDYNILHFMSDRVRMNRMYEVAY